MSFVIVLFGAQITKRELLKKSLKKIFWIPIAAVFSLSTIFSALQYKAWKENAIMKFVFDADGGLIGFVYDAFARHFTSYLLSLALSILLIMLMIWANKRAGRKFFEREEIFIALLAGFLAGFPGLIFFILGLAAVYLLAHLINAIFPKLAKSKIIPLYYFWLPVSASVIIMSELWLSKLGFWSLLSV
ncbi:MAG: hypothetical protein WC519_02565 [Parcubacteria group bacterium]